MSIVWDYLAFIGIYAVGKTVITKLNERRMRSSDRSPKIAHISLKGKITSHGDLRTWKRNPFISPEYVKIFVEKALQNNVKGIIFEINSGGGGVLPSKEISDYISEIELPTVALVKDMAASGAYWAASACDKIIANEYSIVGSVGVILPHFNAQGLLEKIGVEYDGIKSGKYKDMSAPWRKFTDEERKMLEDELGDVHKKFIKAVADNRGMDVEKMRPLAEGQIFHGEVGHENGLVDMLGDEGTAKKYIEQTAKCGAAEIIPYLPAPMGLFASLMGMSVYGIGKGLSNGIYDGLEEKMKEDRNIY